MPLQYVPGRDSRHRTACFALYKALLKQVPKIVLPGKRTSIPGDRVDPIRHLIRTSFRRNKNEDSKRLVVSALSNGYKFLHLLHGATTPASPEHRTVVDLVQRYSSERKSHPPREKSTTKPKHPPLLTRHVNPAYNADEWFTVSNEPRYFYSPTAPPRPAEQLGGSGIRRVPLIAMTSHESPFLRFKKPQPPSLGPALWRRVMQRQRWLNLVSEIEEDGMWFAQREDEWEDLLAGGKGCGAAADRGVTFVDAITKSHAYIKRVEKLDYMDKMQRALALNQIVRAEKVLAEAEAAAREARSAGLEGIVVDAADNVNS